MNASSVGACSKRCAPSHRRCVGFEVVVPSSTRPCAGRSFDTQSRAHEVAADLPAPARQVAVAVSMKSDGTATGVNCPGIASRASNLRVPGVCLNPVTLRPAVLLGAITSRSIPAARAARHNTNPVGPAS
jgi:hypothetical protein